MNTSAFPLRHRLAAVAALFLAGLGNSRADIPPDRLLPLPSNPWVTLGMHRDDVLLHCGKPDETDPVGLWVYWDFTHGHPGAERLDTLVVFFNKGRVSHLRLTDRKSIVTFLEQFRLQQAKGSAAIAAPAPGAKSRVPAKNSSS
jgi:hypothetical protein